MIYLIFYILILFFNSQFILTSGNYIIPSAPLFENDVYTKKNAEIDLSISGAGDICLDNLYCRQLIIKKIDISGAGSVKINMNKYTEKHYY